MDKIITLWLIMIMMNFFLTIFFGIKIQMELIGIECDVKNIIKRLNEKDKAEGEVEDGNDNNRIHEG